MTDTPNATLAAESSEIEESEFGKGYAYCLGLFLAHEWKMFQMRETATESSNSYDRASMWFNGAADHLLELQVPTALPDQKRKQIEAFKDKCLNFRRGMRGEKCEWSDVQGALDEAKDLLREWDVFLNIPSQKGSYQ